MSSLKERLRARERPSATYPLRTAPPAQTAEAERALRAAQRVLTVREGASEPDPASVRKAKRELEKAQAARDACYEEIVIRALPPAEYEALGDAFPPVESDDKAERTSADEAFLEAVFLSCVQGEDMTEQDWKDFLAENCSTGEKLELYDVANAINGRLRAPSGQIPKG